jgi:CheY-like chemotaxis protein
MTQSLLVVDEPRAALELEDILTGVGYGIAARASTVGEALECAHSADIDAAILDVKVGGEWSFAVADELAERQVPFMFATADGAAAVPPRYRNRPLIQKPIHVPGLLLAVTRMTGLAEDEARPGRGSGLGHPFTRAELARAERVLAEGKARIARIEMLLGRQRTHEGKRLLFELHQVLDTMRKHRNLIRRALGLPSAFGEQTRR